MKLLIDADILLYQYAHAGQETFDWGDGLISIWADLDETISYLDQFVTELVKKTASDGYWLCLSGSSPFRYQILPSYKHNRKGTPKPILYGDLKEHMMRYHPFKMKHNLEADDLMGIMATRSDTYIIATIDKDLEQIPGWHFNWKKDAVPRWVTPKQANRWFYQQVLTGDPTDGFSGVPGIGPKKALAILDGVKTEKEAWQAVLDAYASKGLDENYALVQARMARILRASDYDFEQGKPVFWTPP